MIFQHLHDLLWTVKKRLFTLSIANRKERIDRLARLKRILVKYQDQFAEAINQDYGNRSTSETKLGNYSPALNISNIIASI